MATGFRLSALDKQKQRYGMLWYDMVCYGTTGLIEKILILLFQVYIVELHRC